jgi:hypothetical protein
MGQMPAERITLDAVFSQTGLLIGGQEREREGLLSTACTCAVIIQILNNLTTY